MGGGGRKGRGVLLWKTTGDKGGRRTTGEGRAKRLGSEFGHEGAGVRAAGGREEERGRRAEVC